jgi:type I restriction enzyme S subunit
VARAYFAASAKQTTNLASINMAELRGCVFPLPPLAEQSRIVTRVEELMRLCDALENQRQLETAQHAQLLSTLLGTLTDSTSPDELAANWQRVSDHFDLLLDRPEAVDELEETILQLAVRGLLVPQDPSDEPAGVLLKLIAQERERQLSDGLVKRDKKLPDITKAEVPHEIPPGWAWVRLGSIANFIDYRGKTPIKTETGVPLITAKNVRQGYIHREPREFIAESAYAGWMTRGFPRMGDILFTTEAPLGNVAIVDIDERFALGKV